MAKLAVIVPKLNCISLVAPSRLPRAPRPSRPTTLLAPMMPTSAAAGPSPMPLSVAYDLMNTNGTNSAADSRTNEA